ncbi:MAG: UDP-N-acetylglucosamine 2-epimerase (non-hydrolyzing) [Paludibacter sp.]|nr:UDP-N-acetylglucosamine 2-epimerase (non-hydrolyzing) [Paludibacter sp.]
MKIISVVGARPNFMKIAPFCRAITLFNEQNENVKIQHILVHTGQHYDVRMSESFFRSLSIPDPDINMEVGSGSHAEQVGNTMIAFEKVCIEEKPDWVVVVGDVNATLACSVTAKKLNIRLCHIEAGLRSGDQTMPEEINRLVTDRLSDLLLTPDLMSSENLRKEGVPEDKISFVGNIMIDTLENNRDKANQLRIEDVISENIIKETQTPYTKNWSQFAVCTLHRPSNVDQKEILGAILNFFSDEVANDMPVIWAIHPRTQKMLQSFGLWEKATSVQNLILLNPIGYHEMLRLNMSATIMLTDSGGLQEECCVLGTPCLTLRWNTERPVTLKEHGGASVLVGNNIDRIRAEYRTALAAKRHPQRPELWDGKTAMRCVNAIVNNSPQIH